MASSALQKLLRKPPPPPFRFITSFHPSLQPLNPNPNPNPNLIPNPILALPSHTAPQSPTHRFESPTLFFPSFPFGFSRTPLSDHDADVEGSGTLWADSVKKKRKRKMNKHKYRKLRKRMRRQS